MVYRTRRGGNGSVVRYPIVRVTKTQAISNHYRFKRKLDNDYGRVESIPYKAFSPYTFQLPTPSLKLQLQTQELRRELKDWFNEEDNQLTLPQLLSIKKTLTLPDNDLSIWIKVEDLDKDNLPAGDYLGFGGGGDWVVGYLEYGFGVDGDDDIVLVYNNGENISYPTHIISTLALLHLPNHPLPPQTTPTQKEEDVVEWIKAEDLDVDNLPEGDFIAKNVETDMFIGSLVAYDSGIEGVKYVAIMDEVTRDYYGFSHIIPLSQLLKLPTNPSTK